jgi:uncharacterized membrane protein YphA (DoxX/SURF4 family)
MLTVQRITCKERKPNVTTLSIEQSNRSRDESPTRPIMPYALWAAQALLALTFLVAGGMKLAMSSEDLTKDIALPALFLRFIGVCEVLGAFGLILPGVLRIRLGLTPLAAAGLVIIMIGATAITVATMGVAPALFPLVVGLLAAFVGYNRRAWFSAS